MSLMPLPGMTSAVPMALRGRWTLAHSCPDKQKLPWPCQFGGLENLHPCSALQRVRRQLCLCPNFSFSIKMHIYLWGRPCNSLFFLKGKFKDNSICTIESHKDVDQGWGKDRWPTSAESLKSFQTNHRLEGLPSPLFIEIKESLYNVQV